MESTSIAIALTGHRPNKLGGYNINTKPYHNLQKDLEQFIEFKLRTHDIVWGHSGLALGADTIWSKAILAMRKKYPKRVFFHAEIPMWSQSQPWFKTSDTEFWKYQVEKADRYTVYDKTFHEQPDEVRNKLAGQVLDQRNVGMINHCDILLAIYHTNELGGTANAVKYAKSIDKELITIDPNKYF